MLGQPGATRTLQCAGPLSASYAGRGPRTLHGGGGLTAVQFIQLHSGTSFCSLVWCGSITYYPPLPSIYCIRAADFGLRGNQSDSFPYPPSLLRRLIANLGQYRLRQRPSNHSTWSVSVTKRRLVFVRICDSTDGPARSSQSAAVYHRPRD